MTYTVGVLAAFLTSALFSIALPVRVESERCPTGYEVEQVLRSLLPAQERWSVQDVARIDRAGRTIRIILADANSIVIAERMLDDEAACPELARVVAVVIASWESDVHPEFSAIHAEPPQPAPPVRSPPKSAYDIAVGMAASRADSYVVAGRVTGFWAPYGTGPGLYCALTGEEARTLSLGSGQARWRHWMGSLKAAWRLGRPRLAMDAHAGPTAAWLVTSGTEFSDNRSGVSFSPGLGVGLRGLAWLTSGTAAWIDLSAFYWLRDEVLYSLPAQQEHRLPRSEVIGSLGIAFGRTAGR